MSTKELLKALADIGAGELADQLTKTKAGNDLEQQALDAMVKLIGEHGADGVGLTVNLLERLQKGEPMSSEDISSLGLRASSDLLSAMQEAEAEDRKAAVDFATKIGSVLGPLLKAIVVALI